MRLAARFVPPLLAVFLAFATAETHAATAWLNWRGPDQNGVSKASVKMPDSLEIGGPNHRWSHPVRGAGTPVISDGRVFAFGFYGETTDVEETLICLDVKTGEKIWEHRFRDFLSDTTYNRYAIGAPVIDAETGNVYLESTCGVVMALSRDGKLLWEHSMVEKLGRLTFPNGRTGALVIDGPLVITDGITANWGTDGPARNRFYAFDKHTGELVWYSTPGVQPIDSSFATPVFGNLGDQRVFYAGTGCGNIVCVNARTGEPVWRFHLSQAGVNADVVLLGPDKLIGIHGKENVDSTSQGRLVAIRIPTEYPAGPKPVVLGPEAEVWRNDDFIAFSSSPLLVDNRVYSTIATGSLVCADATTGKTIWSAKLGPDQLHASPAYADGKLYVPMLDGNVHVIRAGGDKAEVISVNKLDAPCLGAPAFYGDAVFIFTKESLHCFGPKAGAASAPIATKPAPEPPSRSAITQIQVVPAEFALAPGEQQAFTVYGLDATGRRVRTVTDEATFAKWSPPSGPNLEIDAELAGSVVKAGPRAKLSAGNVQVKWNNLVGMTRGRIVAGPGYKEDFEAFALNLKNDAGEAVAFPPLPWLGARVKWHILEHEGSKVAANRLDAILFQRTMNFIGKPELRDYTFEADVMTDGNRRIMSTVGLVNQRYLIALAANSRILEVSSNHERVKESVPFVAQPNTWYRLKTRVDRDPGGEGGFVRAKLWERGGPEPGAWTIEVRQDKLHAQGAPGIFAFSPQSQKRVFIDNLSLTANE
jgi:outer membrane protein assembly factor BamB